MGQIKNIKLHIVTDIKTRTSTIIQKPDSSHHLKMADGMSNIQQGELMEWVKTTDYTGGVGVTVKFLLKHSEIDKFKGLCKKQMDFVNTQPGVKSFKLHEDLKNPACFWLVEEWESMAAWKPYLVSKERAGNAQEMMPMMAGPPHIALYKIKN